jgi:hypothetical protein
MSKQLLEPILDGGIFNPHYFEGRLLTASDLHEDQAAHRTRQQYLGKALGSGIVQGLWVGVESPGSSSETPVVRVTAGLAITPKGQTLCLPATETLVFDEKPKEGEVSDCLFKDCIPPTATGETTGDGFYVLVLSPVSGFRGRATMSGLSEVKAGPGCGSRWVMEGVQLRLEEFDPLAASDLSESTRQLLTGTLLNSTSDAGKSRLRNVVAHICLGTEPLGDFAADAFARDPLSDLGTEPSLQRYGALDDLMTGARLGDCDVPLAILHWRADGLRFVDNWSVRRRPQAPASSEDWPSLSGGRRRREGEAVLFQFQEQLDDLLQASTAPGSISAKDYFRWLPPAGIVPHQTSNRPQGIGEGNFFGGLTTRSQTIYIDGARLRELLEVSLAQSPIDVETGEAVFVYRPRQNHPPPPAGGSEERYSVFASGHLPYVGTSRFDLARWDRSNFGLL